MLARVKGRADARPLTRNATLAPWRPEMDRARGQAVSGHVSNQHFEYKVGKEAEKAIKLMRGLGVDR